MDDPDRPTARSISTDLTGALHAGTSVAHFFHVEPDGPHAVVVVEAWADGTINRETTLPLDAAQVLIARLWSWAGKFRGDLRDAVDAIENARWASVKASGRAAA